MPDTRFFELATEHGVDPEANLQPIAEIGLSVPVPLRLKDGSTVVDSQRIVIRPADAIKDNFARIIPNTRIVETTSHIVMSALIGHKLGDEVESPTKTTIAKAVKETEAHRSAGAEAARQVALGNEPPPDATDKPVEEQS